MRVVALLLLALAATPALAASDPCAKYTDADAYNYCLAGFGPAAGQRHFSKAPPQDDAPADPRRSARPAPRAGASQPVRRRLPAGMIEKPASRGRVHFQIMVQ